MVKRLRNQHYLAGLGDGNVKVPHRSGVERHEEQLRQLPATQQRYHTRSTRYDQSQDWTIVTVDPSKGGPWPFSAVCLLASVILMSVVFLQLVADTIKKESSSGSNHNSTSKKSRKGRQPYRVHKKTDEWVEDEQVVPAVVAAEPLYQQSQQPQPRHRSRLSQTYEGTGAHTHHHHHDNSSSSKANYYYPSGTGGGMTGGMLYRSPASLTRTGSGDNVLLSQQQSPQQQHRPRADLGAVNLSSCYSSFNSLTGQMEPVNNVLSSTGTPPPRPDSGILMNNSRRVEDETPRMVNGRRMYQPGQPQLPWTPDPNENRTSAAAAAEPWMDEGLQGLQPISMSFATPPDHGRRRHSESTSPFITPQASPYDIPFVPSLGTRHVNNSSGGPPRPINVDELRLHQMESGNMPQWGQQQHEQQQQHQQSPVADILHQSFSSSASSTGQKIPSNDPRAGVDHKRSNLIQGTNSAAALQGAIDYSKLEMVEVIGGGGFGQVWKAKLRGTPVAVKVLTGSAQSTNVPKPVLEEFAAEINLLKGMQHPNICLYMGACVQPPNRAIVTELAANGSLWDALRLPLAVPYQACDGKTTNGWPAALYRPDERHGAPPTPGSQNRLRRAGHPIPPKYAWPWVLVKKVGLGISRGMAYLHGGEPPVLHRDLKSANILLDESYNPKVCDFGLSRLKAKEQSMTGNCGTVQWMAPEVLASQSYNEKADVFSFGIICWELLSRQCPYDGMSAIQCALAVLNRDARPDIPKWCPPPLYEIIRSCLKKNPDDRPNFEALIRSFEAINDTDPQQQ